MASYFTVKKDTNYTLTVSKSGYETHTETINISADTTKDITLTPDFTPETRTFNYTGAVQTFTVPQGCTKIIVDCVGAAGNTVDGSGYGYTTLLGGKGGRVQCKLSVTAGQVLNIYVGGGGIIHTASTVSGSDNKDIGGGWNGGGHGWANLAFLSYGAIYGGGGGGGASDIRIGGTELSNRKIVAGGGGGNVVSNKGVVAGNGGGLTGGNATGYNDGAYFESAKGGTQSSGGTGSLTGSIRYPSGSLGQGGDGHRDSTYSIGSGGGGGYYGGGGGFLGNQHHPGGGGSSYTDPTLCTDVVHTQGYSEATGNGWITITTSN